MVIVGMMVWVIGASSVSRRAGVVWSMLRRIEIGSVCRIRVCRRQGRRKSMRMCMSIWSVAGRG